ncbi:MAG: thiol-disulfide oxidoreductase DCC family protein [Phycisphaerales bacterium]
MHEPATIFFDGECGLCHRGVRFILRHEQPASALVFAPIQGILAAEHLPPDVREHPTSMVVLTSDGAVLTRSAASLFIGRRLRWPWNWTNAVYRLVPRVVRDWIYDLVARNRHRFFSKPLQACPAPTMATTARFRP